jgi:hypothetical protein
MYDDLVKRLRADADYMDNNGIMLFAAAPFYRECADAIEELQQTAKHYKGCSDDWYREACDYKAMLPRWIPVTERLPEDGSDVLAYLKYEVGGRIAAANYDKGMWQDCVMGGLYRTEEGVVTHWMPIPQPPKEENK